MKLVVGIGNPGKKYEWTRHNVGFRVVETLAGRVAATFAKRKCRAKIATVSLGGVAVTLAQPRTFVNLTGSSVRPLLSRLGLELPDLLVVCDDFHMPVGRLRVRRKGSAGGHHGLESVRDALGTDEFARLRLGVGNVAGEDPVDFVLSPFSTADEPVIAEMIARAADAVALWAKAGIEACMNRFNGPEVEKGS